jgi:hypothetical protein
MESNITVSKRVYPSCAVLIGVNIMNKTIEVKDELTARREALRQARKTLGLCDSNSKSVSIEDRSTEGLLATIDLMNIRFDSRLEGHKAEVKALQKNLNSKDKAKRAANRRADLAEAKLKKIMTALALPIDNEPSGEQS